MTSNPPQMKKPAIQKSHRFCGVETSLENNPFAARFVSDDVFSFVTT